MDKANNIQSTGYRSVHENHNNAKHSMCFIPNLQTMLPVAMMSMYNGHNTHIERIKYLQIDNFPCADKRFTRAQIAFYALRVK